jgi:hypothetical protein
VEIRRQRVVFRDETLRVLFVVFEIFDLTEAFRCFLARLVRAAEIFSFFGRDFVALFYFFDHDRFPPAGNYPRHRYGINTVCAVFGQGTVVFCSGETRRVAEIRLHL